MNLVRTGIENSDNERCHESLFCILPLAKRCSGKQDVQDKVLNDMECLEEHKVQEELITYRDTLSG